jgi:hypothetical protein
LQAGKCWIASGAVQHPFHHSAVLIGRLSDNADLPDAGRQIMQPVHGVFGQAPSHHNDKLEILISLGAQAGQGKRFEQVKPFIQALRGIKIGPPRFDRFMLDLKTADGRV